MEYVVYFDPEKDIDEQREQLRQYLYRAPGQVLEEHIGGYRAAEHSASTLGAILVSPAAGTVDSPEAKAHTRGQRRRAKARYEAVRGHIRHARLLGIDTNSGIARYLTERGVPLPSGKAGKWQANQVKRALDWLGEVSQ